MPVSTIAKPKPVQKKKVVLKNVSLEKYGRLLADVYVDGIHVNAWMKQKGHAVDYFGGKKTIQEPC